MASSVQLEALLKKIPDLDPDLGQILKDAKLSDKASDEEVLAAVVKQRPDLADLLVRPRQGKVTGPNWDEAVKVYDAVLAGGAGSIVGLLDMLKEVDDGEDYKPRYVLGGIAQYVCRADKAKQQDLLIEALLMELPKRPRPIQAFILQQLQACGDKRALPAVGKLLTDEELCDKAAAALSAIGEGAAEPLRQALPKAGPKARLTIVKELGVHRDAASAAALKQAAGDGDVQVRIAAVWGLANLGDASAVDAAIKASNAEGWERIKGVQACLMLADKLAASGRKDEARKIYTHLRDTRTDKSEKYLRDIADKALSAG